MITEFSGFKLEFEDYSNSFEFNNFKNKYNKLDGFISDISNKEENSDCHQLIQMLWNNKNFEFTKEIIEKCHNSLNNKFTPFQVTPLMVAVITGNEQAVNYLLENKNVNPNELDHHRYTALHHAAIICNLKMLKILIKKGVEQSILNDLGGMAQDYLDMTKLQKEIDKFKGDEYGFTNRMAVSSEILIKIWETFYPISKDLAPVFTGLKNEFIDSFRWKDKVKIMDSKTSGLQVIATEDIKIGEFVAPILGEFQIMPSINDSNSYKYNVDHNKIRHIGSIPEDSFPNVVKLKFKNLKGLREMSAYFAIRPIFMGEQIFVNHGDCDVKFLDHKEFQKDELLEFFKTHKWEDFIKAEKIVTQVINNKAEFDLDNDYYLNFLKIAESFRYVLHTPLSFLILLENDLISVGQLLKIFKDKKILEYFELSATLRAYANIAFLYRFIKNHDKLNIKKYDEIEVKKHFKNKLDKIFDKESNKIVESQLNEFIKELPSNQFINKIRSMFKLFLKTKNPSLSFLAFSILGLNHDCIKRMSTVRNKDFAHHFTNFILNDMDEKWKIMSGNENLEKLINMSLDYSNPKLD